MKTKTKARTKAPPLVQMIDGLSKCLTTESAKQILEYRVDAKLQKQIDDLADKCTDGRLTPEERAEYGDCVVLGDFIAILKSKIRQRLAKEGR